MCHHLSAQFFGVDLRRRFGGCGHRRLGLRLLPRQRDNLLLDARLLAMPAGHPRKILKRARLVGAVVPTEELRHQPQSHRELVRLAVVQRLLSRSGYSAALAASGAEAAFAAFYDETSHRVYGMVLRIVRDRGLSEETTQEVFLTVWRSAHTFDPESGSPLGWLMTLAHRRAVDRVRSETAAKRRLHVYSTAEQSTRIEHDVVSESAERRETVREVRSLLSRLTELQREAIELAYFRGMTYREVADELGVALPTALKMLRDVVTEPRYVAEVDRVHDQVRNGRRFAEALSESDLLPPLAARMLRVGDETGDLPAITRHAAQFYEHRLGIGLDRLMGAIGPATIILVSVVIGALIVSIMSALLSITELAL